ncbi:PfkB family carbohydrate kinase [Myceligenerans pegani]|uniref:Bifunctional heptose 7-phosphate kinase/heptose 1-phosphate adenyltransferase n=1 Tax=Myceligenerans pegani TaxID=2776917 RepID=A0ABR9MZY9_9MICO|nr:PfkB family carbohydrate kinase [Myceligenerans sp. TRM 65318]MBE1876561.1 bifunctional heptose 7-phosphate kinase/heptose 1-phosphate adenyltransferase [Myceligenerans sp. TRM 65318]MBE3018832.1 bifunctional heptose 7-phosphate kinase/heptose 1-phosphate adenyltransferase [Myceligenerans sp. TRM 65318]
MSRPAAAPGGSARAYLAPVPGDTPPRPRITVVGDVLLDRDIDGTVTRLAPDAPVPVVDVTTVRHSPGGAGLAALLCAERADVVLVAPIADDADGRELRHRFDAVTLVPLGHEGSTRRKTRVRSDGQGIVRVDEGGPGTPTGTTPDALARARDALAGCDAVLVADYGGGTTHDPHLRHLLAEAAGRVPLVWDPHPRGGPPVPGAALVTPNEAEAERAAHELAPRPGAAVAHLPDLAGVLRRAWDARAVSITAGERGAFVTVRPAGAADGEPAVARHLPARPAHGPDSCGAGDRFAATVTERLARGDEPSDAVREGVLAASAWVASGGADGFRRALEDGPRPATRDATSLEELGARLRAAGGVLVATGGCFDLLHAGHVSMLEGARRLGDHLVVLVNSDRSVRRLKGPERPLVPLAERLRVLESLACVDAAVVLESDEPSRAIAELRPDVWAKGGDYTVSDLPEAAVVRSSGGRVVTLPYLPGHSTTRLVDRIRESESVTAAPTMRRSS